MYSEMSNRYRKLALHIGIALAFAGSASTALSAEVASGLRATAERDGKVDALIVLSAKAPKSLLRNEDDYLTRRRALVDTLRATADVSQSDLRQWLDQQGVVYRPYWIVNMIQAELTPAQLYALAERADIARIAANRSIVLQRPEADEPMQPWPSSEQSVLAAEWGVAKVRAPEVWSAGFTGQGIVVAGQDTGIRWTHAAIKAKYRGWNGSTANHNYNWHDAVHGAGNMNCAGDRQAPCDDHNHGTHTIGTIVGDDGVTNQIGVAPGAQWIGCRNMNGGAGTPARYNECAEFFLAPTDLAGNNPNPDLAPDVINNSWGCDGPEGCTTGEEVRAAIENLVAGGIVFVASAGNDGTPGKNGPECSTILNAPALFDDAFVVGSTTSADAMSGFSSRGPVPGLASVKPDVVAPGSSVRSALRTGDANYGNMSGTSMAGPHVAGVVALIMSVDPSLRGDPARVHKILRDSAVPIVDALVCGGIPATTFPNPVQGSGRIDAWNAFLGAEKIFADDFEP